MENMKIRLEIEDGLHNKQLIPFEACIVGGFLQMVAIAL
jgi:hypothetical protein